MQITPGRPWPLGATVDRAGVNFALFSAHAERVELCLFLQPGHELRLTLPDRDGDIWHGFVPGLEPGTAYGYRVHGPLAPEIGHRFNPAKLLLDPYARALTGPLRWCEAMQGTRPGISRGEGMPDGRDSARHMPRALVCAPAPALPWARPNHSWAKTVLYEAHVKGLTATHPDVPPDQRGRYAGLGSDAVLAHLTGLGVTALQLLPVHAFIDDRFVTERGLSNYWGYQSLGFFAADPRYGTAEDFRAAVRRLHAAGIEVILDVVFNHTGEGDEQGPTLGFRGIDNASYYRLREGGRAYVNDTGTGNTLNLSHPMALRLVMDALRYWHHEMGACGFRFDLATVLGRDRQGNFASDAPLLSAIRQDPGLAGVKLIAEPWDIGPGGYQLGAFPHPFAEWNDRFRDGLRRFWRGDAGQMADLARRIAGSAETFDHSGRPATASINFVTAHDGFTLHDLVSFSEKHNQANGENNHDGHHENHSQALTDPLAQGARKRALLASLLLAQGTPMLLAGDEIGNTQGGNNNAYAQDNPVSWLDWNTPDTALCAFVARLLRLRAAHPVLRQRRFLHSRPRVQDGVRDLIWRLPSGAEPSPQDWHDPQARCLAAEIRGAAEGPEGEAAHEAVFAVFNAGGPVTVTLPQGRWRQVLDSARPEAAEQDHPAPTTRLAGQSVQVFTRPTGGALQETA